MTPHKLHAKARAIYTAILEERGIPFEVLENSRRKGCDLLVNQLLVVICASFAHRRCHTSTVNGKTYRYVLNGYRFNFHRRKAPIACDVLACVSLTRKGGLAKAVLNIPRTDATGKTLTLWCDKPREGKYLKFFDNWTIFSELVPSEDTKRLRQAWSKLEADRIEKQERIIQERVARLEVPSATAHGASVHYVAYREVREELVRRRVRFHEMRKSTGSPYFVTADGLIILVRGTFLTERYSAVTRKRDLYEYHYPAWQFGLGKQLFSDRERGVIICVPLRRTSGKNPGKYVIPWEAITGQTFQIREGFIYRGRYAEYHERWNIVEKRPNQKAA